MRAGSRGGGFGGLGFEIELEAELAESSRRAGGGGRLSVERPVVSAR